MILRISNLSIEEMCPKNGNWKCYYFSFAAEIYYYFQLPWKFVAFRSLICKACLVCHYLTSVNDSTNKAYI